MGLNPEQPGAVFRDHGANPSGLPPIEPGLEQTYNAVVKGLVDYLLEADPTGEGYPRMALDDLLNYYNTVIAIESIRPTDPTDKRWEEIEKLEKRRAEIDSGTQLLNEFPEFRNARRKILGCLNQLPLPQDILFQLCRSAQSSYLASLQNKGELIKP